MLKKTIEFFKICILVFCYLKHAFLNFILIIIRMIEFL
jgi:hypothetical protein